MADTPALPEAPPKSTAVGLDRRRRLLALGVVLSVSFANFIATSFYYLFAGEPTADPSRTQFRLLFGLITEGTSLLLLWFVLSGQGRTWREIGWAPRWEDIMEGIGLIIVARGASYVVNLVFQLLYRHYTGHYLLPRTVHNAANSGISVLSILFVAVNPFFEELIVRGYVMSEVAELGGSNAKAILVSVLIQVSYHTYQGLLRGVGLATAFVLFSIYFSRKRRIAPVIIAHCYFDAFALIRSSF